jgi:hypothetical protein
MEDLLSRETTSCLAGQERKPEIKLPCAQDPYNMVKVMSNCHSKCHKGVGGSRCVASLILNFGTGIECSVYAWPLTTWDKKPRHPLSRRMCGPQGRYWRLGEKKVLSLPGVEPLTWYLSGSIWAFSVFCISLGCAYRRGRGGDTFQRRTFCWGYFGTKNGWREEVKVKVQLAYNLSWRHRGGVEV